MLSLSLGHKDLSKSMVAHCAQSILWCMHCKELIHLNEMKRRNSHFGLETICGGCGLGIAAVVERRGF